MNSNFIIIHLTWALCVSFYIQKWSLLSVYIIYSVKGKIKVKHLRVNNQLYSATKEPAPL